MMEKVSVIIPTYKRTVEYLSRAVESVIEQTYPNIEIIVVDDSPGTYEHRSNIKKYMDGLIAENIIYLQNETNIGGSLSRNKGIDIAKGDFITFLDDDDEYLPRKVEKQLAFMLDGEYDLSFSDMIMYDVDGKVVDYREYKDIPSFANEALLKYHLMKHLTGTPTFMFRADRLSEIGGFDDARMGQEFYLMLKSIERGLKIGYLLGCDVKVYKHRDGGITQGRNKIDGENVLYSFKKKYFPMLSGKEKRFIRFRHYAVMVVAYKRNKMWLKSFWSASEAFIVSPLDFLKEVSMFGIKILEHRKERIQA